MIPKKMPKPAPTKSTPNNKKTNNTKAQTKKDVEYNKDGTIRKPHLPKSKYTAEGKPIQVIPTIDDLNLDSMMGKYLNGLSDKKEEGGF